MASKRQANPSCATGISFIEFLLDKSEGRLHYSTSSAIEWCENYLNRSKTLGGVLTRKVPEEEEEEETWTKSSGMHALMHAP